MGYDSKEQLARSITLALTTGLFSIVPVVAEGAPVVDKVVTEGTSVQQTGKVTDVTSTVQNNIVNWKDFSVAKDEAVRFDKGAQTNNYLNIVTGPNQSEIAGKVEGGKNVYIVNPHGVLIDKGATVNVGNLYVSTTTEKLDTKAYLATGASPLVNTASAAAADVTNMGSIQADSVTVEGGVVKFLDTADVSATGENVTITAKTAQIGQQAPVASSSPMTGIRRSMATPSTTGKSYHVIADQIDNFTTIATASQFNTIVRKTPSGKYWLKNDIDMSGISYTPISSFSGVLDGNFYSIKNLTLKNVTGNSGLFLNIKGASNSNPAKIYDLGLRNFTITFDSDNFDATPYVGALAATATNATITNVYNAGSKLSDDTRTGGILGYAQNVTMDSVYNTANVGTEAGSGIVSMMAGNVTITNAYNTGKAHYGVARTGSGKNNTVSYAYDDQTTSGAESIVGATDISADDKTVKDIKSSNKDSYKYSSQYADWGKEISNSGDSDSTWRIYEGESLPLLRAFLRANGKVTVNYDYTMGDKSSFSYAQSGSNGGSDLTATYNSKALSVSNLSFTDTTYGKTISSAIGSNTTIKKSSHTFQNVEADSTDSHNALTRALYYTDQDGYDLVGNNVTIQKRTVNLSQTDYKDRDPLSKTYDGTTDVDQTKLTNYLTSSSNTTTPSGLIYINGSLDPTVKQSSNTLKGVYNSKNVADAKTITVNGTLGYDNKKDYYNYDFGTSNSATFTNLIINGKITKKDVSIALATSNPTRTYTGKYDTAVADTKTQKYRLTTAGDTGDEIFTLTGKVKSGAKGVNGTAVTADDKVYVTTTETNGTGDYGDGTGADFDPTGTAGSHNVRYKGITLGGDDAGNYNLTNLNADGAYYTTGTIEQKEITSDSLTFNGNDMVSREYNGNQFYDDVASGTLSSTDIVTYADNTKDDVTFTMKANSTDGDTHKGHSAWFTKDGTDVSDKGDDYDVTYNVSIGGADAGNYKIVNGNTTTSLVSGTDTDATLTKSGGGSIKARTLYLKAGANADKYYDGDAAVKVSGKDTFDLSSGVIVYEDAADTAHQLVSGDGATLSVKGTYAGGADVLWTNGKPAAKGITYTVTASTDNYVIRDAKTKNVSSTATGSVTGASGTIYPRKITALTFADVSKTYDGKNTVGGVQANDKIKLTKVTLDTSDGTSLSTNDDGLIGTTDSIATIFNTDDIKGTYGSYDTSSKTFIVNQHADETGDVGGHVVLGSDNKTPAKQDVRFSGIALKNSTGNYVLALDSATSGTETDGSTTFYGTDKGLITPLTVKNPTLTLKDSVSKVYNATSYVSITDAEVKFDDQNTAYNAANNVKSVTAKTDSGTTITLTPDLTSLAQEDAYYTDASGAETANATDNNGAKGVTYNLTFKATDNPDYTINGLGTDNKLAVAATLGDGQTATIAKRTLTPTITTTGLTKKYDATQALEDASGNTLADGDTLVTFDGWLKDASGANTDANIKNTSTGIYTTDGNVWHENGDLSTTANHSITYTAQIDGTNKGNYTIATPTDFTKVSDTEATYTDTTGKIEKRETDVTFTKLTKTYDGRTSTENAKLPDGVTAYYSFTNLAPNGTDGTSNGALDESRLKATYTSEYANANVNTAQNPNWVNYTDLALDGAAAGNYTLAKKTTTGEGAIETNKLTRDNVSVLFNDNDPFTKTYDGSADVAYDHTDTTTYFSGLGEKTDSRTAGSYVKDITLGGVSLDTLKKSDGSDVYSIASATYGKADGTADASAGTGKKVSYAIQLDYETLKNNFDFSELENASDVYDSGSKQLKKTATGTITEKLVKVGFDDRLGGNTTDQSGRVTKVYNAGVDVVSNTQDNTTGTALKNSDALFDKITYTGLVGDDAKAAKTTIASIDGVYGNKNVTTPETRDNVTYTLTNANANYKLVKADATSADDAVTQGNKLEAGKGTGIITPKDITATFGTVVKTYDTTAKLDSTTDAGDTVSVTLASGDKQGSDDVSATVDFARSTYLDSADGKGDAANAGTGNKRVKYVFTLTGADAGNYHLANTDATQEAGRFTKITTGNTINKKALNDIDVTWSQSDPFAKTYDGSATVTYTHNAAGSPYLAGYDDGDARTAGSYVKSLSLDNHTYTAGNGYTVDEENSVYDSADAGERTATFLFDIDDSVLANYDLSGVAGFDATKNQWPTTHAGKINAKYVQTAFDDSQGGNSTIAPGLVTKVYDGTTALVTNDQASAITAGGTALNNTEALTKKFAGTTGFLSDDDKAKYLNVAGVYVDTTNADNSVTAAKDAGEHKDVQYTATLGSTNYQFVSPTNGVRMYTGKGNITAKELTIEFGNVEKTYDAKADVTTTANQGTGNVTTITPTLVGLVNNTSGETQLSADSNASGLIKGYYGTWDATEGITKDANVNWDATNNIEKSKGVVYTGLDKAFEQLQDDHAVMKNYKLAGVTIDGSTSEHAAFVSAKNNGVQDTAYFKEAANKGKIKRLSLVQSDIKTKWKAYSKDYDGTSDIVDYKNALQLYVDHAGTVDLGQTINIAYNGSAKFYNSDFTKEQTDRGTGLGIEATINSIKAEESSNFDMSKINTKAFEQTYRNDKDTDGTTARTPDGTITARHLVAMTNKNADLDKVYDGNANVLDAPTKFTLVHIGKDADGNDVIEDGILSKDTAVNAAVTGAYYTNASGTDDANVDNETAGTSPHHIRYTGEITGDTAGNYAIGASDGTKVAKDYTYTKDTKVVTDTEDATGHITPRPVYVELVPETKDKIDKDYDTTDAVKNASQYVELVAKTGDTTAHDGTGIVDDDAKTVTLSSGVTGTYDETSNVKRDPETGAVTTQAVTLSNFQLDGDDAGNYQLVTKSLTGKGTIRPKNITVTYDNASDVEKTYDGTSSVEADDLTTIANALNGVIATAKANNAPLLLGTDTLTFMVTDGAYTNGGKAYGHTNETAGAQKSGLGVQTQVSWTNGNYDVTFDAADSTKQLDQTDTATAVKNGTATFTKTIDTTQGTITPRTLTVKSGKGAAKDYNGTTSSITHDFTSSNTSDAEKSALLFDNLAPGEAENVLIATGTGTFYDVNDDTKQVKDAADSSGEDSTTRLVKWDLVLQNKDYTLDGTTAETKEGTGIIKRAPLTFASDNVQGRFGQTPTFTGTVTGWQPDGEEAKFNAASESDPTFFVWNTAPGTSPRGNTSSPIYGWYRYGTQTATGAGWSTDPNATSDGTNLYAMDGANRYRNFGNYGLNYTFVQAPGDYTAQADAPNTDILNPARRVRPDMEVYNHVSHDEIGTAIRDPKAGIEYQAGGTSLRADSSADYVGTMTVTGAGDVVNLTESTPSADRIDLTDESADYTLTGAESVPTADVEVTDITSADVVTDDDKEIIGEATETDEHEAEAAIETTDDDVALFHDIAS